VSARGIFAGAVLLAMAAASWLLVKTIKGDRAEGPVAAADAQGYYIKDAAILGTDVDGGLLYTVEAKDIRHIPPENKVALTEVKVLYSATGRPTWSATSATGSIDDAGAEISLEGEVRLQNDSDQVGDEFIIETEKLLFSPRERFASTDLQVRITQPGVVLTAIGMDADLENEMLQLKAAVSGQFRP